MGKRTMCKIYLYDILEKRQSMCNNGGNIMKKRFWGVLFILCIALCFIPATAFAEDNAGEILVPNDGDVYHSGDVIPVRWTLNTYIKADDKMTVELLDQSGSQIYSWGDFRFDLGGANIQVPAGIAPGSYILRCTLKHLSEDAVTEPSVVCGEVTILVNTVPEITISGADRVCNTQDYTFKFTLPEEVKKDSISAGYEFEYIGSDVNLVEQDGVYTGTVESTWYDKTAESFDIVVYAKTTNRFGFSVRKTVTLLAEHTGGTATCMHKAVCEVCKAEYGATDPSRHGNLVHVDAKSSTTTSEGNIEYWHCSECGKYFADSTAEKEITKEKTVIAKLKNNSGSDDKKPEKAEITKTEKAVRTGDRSSFGLWIALLFVSGGAIVGTTVAYRKKY